MNDSKSSKIPVTSKKKFIEGGGSKSSVLARTKENVSNRLKTLKAKSPLLSRLASRKVDKENINNPAYEIEEAVAEEKPLETYRSLDAYASATFASPIVVGIVHDYVEVEKPIDGEGEDCTEDVVVLLSPCDVNLTNKFSPDSLDSLVNVTAQEMSRGTVVVTSDVVMSDSRTRSKEVIFKYIQAFAEYFPEESVWRRILLASKPAISHTIKLLHVFISILAIKIEVALFIAHHIWELLQPFQPQLLLPAVMGLVLCFFGGSFMALIGAVEAYRMCGYETTLKSINYLKEDFEKIKMANNKDDAMLDEDSSGAADVLTVRSGQDLLLRKTSLFLKTVDPHRFVDALVGINVGFVAVVATLKVKFAKAVTLGNSLGDLAEEPANQLLLPMIEGSLPLDYQGWAKPCLRYAVKSIAISLAWYLQRAISSYHSAITGGIMFGKHILGYLHAVGLIKDKAYVDNDHLVCCIGYVAAFLGVYFQMSFGFFLPFPLNLLLLPFTFLEYALLWVVHNSTSFFV